MYGKYNIILFHNNNKKKLIKKYTTLNNAEKKFKQLINENKKIIFSKKYQNHDECNYYLGLITSENVIQKSLYLKDDLGRNIPVNINNSSYVFLNIEDYKIEELIYDWQVEKKINLGTFIEKYTNNKDLKNIFVLNNKICVQKDDIFNLFSLKNKEDSDRFLEVLENYFRDNGRSDAIFVRDTSSAQRKWIYRILEERGFDKKRLYRLKTTFSKR